MDAVEAQLRSRRIALLGLGVENRDLARYLASRAIPFAVCDTRRPPDIESLKDELGDRITEWRLGANYLEDLDRFDLIFRTPGISPLRPELLRAAANRVQFSSQTRLFARLCPAPIVGVTGTKGKGTTISLLAAIAQTDPARATWTGGNIGLPPISFLDRVAADDRVLLELSSFQLIDWETSPHVALVLSVTCDHLDYHADREEYVAAKRNLCHYQGVDDWLIVDADCPTSRSFAADSPARLLSFSTAGEVERGAWAAGDHLWLRRPSGAAERICPLAEIPLRGRHNWSNAAAATAAAVALGIPTERIAAGIRRFRPLPHRLEPLGRHAGIAYYNDSLATTPDSAIAAVEAFDEPLVLIAGGSPKGADFTAFGRTIATRRVRALILLGQEGARIAAAVRAAGDFSGALIEDSPDMRAAVETARRHARSGDVVLLSPACASFGMFSSYRDRGDQFRRWVSELAGAEADSTEAG